MESLASLETGEHINLLLGENYFLSDDLSKNIKGKSKIATRLQLFKIFENVRNV